MNRKVVAILTVGIVLILAGCSYTTVPENRSALKLVDGKVAESITDAQRVNTFSVFHDVVLKQYDVGIFDSTFTNIADEGDRARDDSIKVNTFDKAQPSANVNVTAQFDRSQTRCLFKASITSGKDFRDKLLRGEIRSAIQQYAALVSAPEFATKRKGEIATAALRYVQMRFGDKIDKPAPIAEGEDELSYKIASLRPTSQLPKSTACNTQILRLQITDVSLPKEQQEQLNTIIAAEAARQAAEAGQRTKEAEAKGAEIEALGNAKALEISSTAQANANARISASMSPQLSQLEAIKACARALEKTQANVASCGGGSGAGGGSTNIVIPAG